MKFLFGNWLNDDLDVERAWPMVDNERKSVLETNYLLLRLWAGPAGCHFGCSDDDDDDGDDDDDDDDGDDDDDDDIYIMMKCLSVTFLLISFSPISWHLWV